MLNSIISPWHTTLWYCNSSFADMDLLTKLTCFDILYNYLKFVGLILGHLFTYLFEPYLSLIVKDLSIHCECNKIC